MQLRRERPEHDGSVIACSSTASQIDSARPDQDAPAEEADWSSDEDEVAAVEANTAAVPTAPQVQHLPVFIYSFSLLSSYELSPIIKTYQSCLNN